MHIAVIGNGIVGTCAAAWLQRDGHRVTFIDKNLQHRVGLIVRVNQYTATLDCDGQKWRVAFELLRHLVDV